MSVKLGALNDLISINLGPPTALLIFNPRGIDMLGKLPISPRPWESLNEARKAVRDKLHYVRGRWGHKIKKCLTYNGGNDFTLNEDSDSVWIQVDEYVIYIRRNEKAVTAEIINPDGLNKLDAIDIAVGYWKKRREKRREKRRGRMMLNLPQIQVHFFGID